MQCPDKAAGKNRRQRYMAQCTVCLRLAGEVVTVSLLALIYGASMASNAVLSFAQHRNTDKSQVRDEMFGYKIPWMM